MTKAHEKLVDEGSFVANDGDLPIANLLDFPEYEKSLRAAQEGTGESESVTTGRAVVGGHEIEFASFNFEFLGGSMGSVAGELLARAIERAAKEQRPFVLRCATGGARMQEGMKSLAQMPKIVAARIELARAHMPYVVLFDHPTTGGVLASLGALADVTFAIRGATIGFAGPRIVEQFTGHALAEGSHTAESALHNGLVDRVVTDEEARSVLIKTLGVLSADVPVEVEARALAVDDADIDEWDIVRSARASERASGPDLAHDICDETVELRGDRSGSDDSALHCIVGRVAGRKAVVIATGRATAPTAAGLRKARRCIEVAGRLNLPVVTIVDTTGADPSEDSEASGVAWEIARLFESVLTVPVPVVSVVTGEGGSGGALALAVADALVAYSGSFFSVINPESAAEILWRDASRAPEAARALKLSATDLVRLGIADEIVAEPLSGESLRRVVAYHLDRLTGGDLTRHELALERQRRWRKRDQP